MNIEPKNTNEFIGNKDVVTSFKKWIKSIKDDKSFNRRVCFLTGSVGTGKSILAKIALEEEGFDVCNFLSTGLRMKNERELLYQTINFKNVLAIINKKKTFRKAVIVDDYENMGLATQEVFRKIKKNIKDKPSGIPIVFIGNKYFKSKKPLMGISIYLRLEPRNNEDIQLILNQITENNNIIIDNKEKLELCKKSGGDIRKIIKYFELNFNKNINSKDMFSNKKKGPLFSLNRILNHNLSIDEILEEVACEKSLPLGMYTSYINYVPWFIKKNKLPNNSPYLLKEIAKLFSIYGSLKDYERKHQYWSLNKISDLLSLFGPTTLLKYNSNKKEYPKTYNGKQFWWVELEKGKKKGDEPIDITIYSKTLRSHLNKSMLDKTPFKMIEKNICNPKAWRPKNIRHTLQIMNLKKEKPDISSYILKLIYQ